MSTTRIALALVIVGALLVGALSVTGDRHRYPAADADAVKYLQAAESLLAGTGLTTPRDAVSAPWGEVREPYRNWPPGYSLLIAAVSKATGAAVMPSGLWISRCALALLPMAMLFCLGPLRLEGWAAAIALLAAFSSGFLWSGMVPRSDAPFCLMVCLVLLSLRRFLATERAGWLFAAALLAGLSYTVRTVGVALVLAVPLALTIARIRSGHTRSVAAVLRAPALWTVSAAVPVAALLAYNLKTFGQLQPYSLPPSTVGLVANIRWLMAAVISDASSTSAAGPWIAWTWPALMAASLLAGYTLAMFCRRRILDPSVSNGDAAFALTLVLYALGSAAILVLGRTKYQWGELINDRYVAQFTWIVMAVVLCWARDTWSSPSQRRALTVAVAIVCVAAAVPRVLIMSRTGDSPSLAVAASQPLQRSLRQWAASGDTIVSNDALLLSLLGGVSVRQLQQAPGAGCGKVFSAPLAALEHNPELSPVSLHAVMVLQNPCIDYSPDAGRSGWAVEQSTPAYVVLKSPTPR